MIQQYLVGVVYGIATPATSYIPMTHIEIREKFLKYFESKGHKIVPSSSLLPDDPSVLFTTAGMQQFKKYYTDEADPLKDFGTKNTASIQKSMRTSDIDEVGDESHLTFFEMLGNFSFGGYFKKEAIEYAHEFITKEMGLTIDYISVFAGEPGVPEDTESADIWKSIDANLEIKKSGRPDNFWGPTGDEGPCGPTTEIHVDGIEIWNIVFNEYYKKPGLPFEALAQKGIDTGMGLERLAKVVQKVPTVFDTDLFSFAKGLSRVIADHSRAITFLVSDGVMPSNKDQGYVLRRLMRRIMVHKGIDFVKLFTEIVKTYGEIYPELNLNKILDEFEKEREKFGKTLEQGLRELKKINIVDAPEAFKLYESYGLPYEVIKQLSGATAKLLTRESFDEEYKKHQAKSREGSIKKFGGHGLLLDTGELKASNEEELKKVTRLHTATHMLQAALRKVLGDQVQQAGSDITAERLRFDFTFSRKMTIDEIREVENLINKVIKIDLPVTHQELAIEEAKKTGTLYFFKEKYPNRVKVYSVGPSTGSGSAFSRELCGGPHVSHTAEIGHFKIIKEEAVSAGTRRIRATVN